MKPIYIKDAEITVVDVTFIVDYNYYQGTPVTDINPADPAEVEILRVEIKGQQGNADELLQAIKVNITIDKSGVHYSNGYDLLETEILKAHQQ